MSSNTLRETLRNRLEEISTLRDEIRLDLHLGGMDLRDQWRRIEARLPDPRAMSEETMGLAAEILNGLREEMRKFQLRMKQRDLDPDVSSLMSSPVQTCRPGEALAEAVARMRDRDIGCLPVVDAQGRVVGMLTDRDACMAACVQARPLSQINVEYAMATDLATCLPGDTLEDVQTVMSSRRVRRLPVIDGDRRLRGIVSLTDLAREAARPNGGRRDEASRQRRVAATLAAIGEPQPRRSSVASASAQS